MNRECALPIVFVGISLSQAEAGKLIPADIRPPVKRGDLDQVRADALVAIIDGELDPISQLPIEEIRRSLLRGVRVIGAASLGALSAHSAKDDGMQGAGWVYRAYQSGRIEGADEIAVIFDPLTCQALTIPLVNVRFCLDVFKFSGALTEREVQGAMSALRALDFESRTGAAIQRRLLQFFGKEDLASALGQAQSKWDIKRCDASLLLRELRLRLRVKLDSNPADLLPLCRQER